SADVLIDQFFHREGVSERTGRIRSAVRNQIRLLSVARCSIECFLKNAVPIFPIGDEHDLCSEQLIEQQISGGVLRLIPGQHENTFESESSRCRRSLTAMIRLDCDTCDQHLRALLARFCYEKF